VRVLFVQGLTSRKWPDVKFMPGGEGGGRHKAKSSSLNCRVAGGGPASSAASSNCECGASHVGAGCAMATSGKVFFSPHRSNKAKQLFLVTTNVRQETSKQTCSRWPPNADPQCSLWYARNASTAWKIACGVTIRLLSRQLTIWARVTLCQCATGGELDVQQARSNCAIC
jgi:hypothetical protein